MLLGSSGGSCSQNYYATGQVEAGERIWRDHLPGKFMKWDGLIPRNDPEHLERIMREIEPLDCSLLKRSRAQIICALTDPVRQKTVYFSVNQAIDPISISLASTAMPFFSRPAIHEGKEYYDPNVITAIPFKYLDRFALTEKDEIWLILTTPHGYRKKAWRWKMASWFVKDKRIKKLLSQRANTENKILEEIEMRNNLFVIRPEKPLPIHWRENGAEGIRKTLELGKEAARKFLATRGKHIIPEP